jgi:hypothetical protein
MPVFKDLDSVLIELSHVNENQRRIIIKNFHCPIS